MVDARTLVEVPLGAGLRGSLRALKALLRAGVPVLDPMVSDEALLYALEREGPALGEPPRVELEGVRRKLPRWEMDGPGELVVDAIEMPELLAAEFAMHTFLSSPAANLDPQPPIEATPHLLLPSLCLFVLVICSHTNRGT